MGFWQSIRNALTIEVGTSSSPQPQLERPEGGNWRPIIPETTRAVPAAHACVTLLSETLARLPMSVVATGAVRTPVENHPVSALLNNPCLDLDRFTFWADLGRDLFTNGNAYALIERDRDGTALRLRRASLAALMRDRGQWIYQLNLLAEDGYARVETTPWLRSESVIHLKWSQFDRTKGVSESPIRAAARAALGLYLASQAHQENTLSRGAHSPVAVGFDPVFSSAAELSKLKDEVRNKSGYGKAGQLMLLPPGAKVQSMGFSSVDLQLIEVLKFSIQDLARVWQIPLFLLQSLEQSSGGWTNTNLQEQFTAFHRLSLGSHIARYTSELNAKLLPLGERRSRTIHIDGTALTMGTMQDVAVTAETLVSKAAIMTPNEAREMIGRPPVEGGDSLRQPTGAPAQMPEQSDTMEDE